MFRVLMTFVALAYPATAAAQDWAKDKLNQSPRHGEWVKIRHGDRDVQSFVVFPESKDKATAVVVVHEIFGLADWVRLLADELAEAGYIAIAPDLLSGTGPDGGGTDKLGGDVRKAIRDLPPDRITADLDACVDYVAKLPACNGKVAVAGFCWGGGQSFRFATNNKTLKAAFVFYGGSPEPEDLAKVQCPVYGFYAENDARINATLDATAAAIKQHGKTFERVIYQGGGHGFMRSGEGPQAREGDVKARAEAWKRWRDLLKRI